LTAGGFHRFAFAEAGPDEAGKVLEALEPAINFFIDRHEDRRMEMDVSFRIMPGALVSRQWLAGLVAKREAVHAAQDGNDDLCLLVSLSGGPIHLGLPDRRHGHHEATTMPGMPGLLRGNDERYSAHSAGSETLVICVPRPSVLAAVADLGTALDRGVPQSAALNLLAGFASTLTTDIGPMNSETVLQTRETLTDLFILALGPSRDGAEAAKGGAQAARLARIKADIAANLGNPDLSLEWLAKRQTTRPRAIQDLFYAAGEGFTEYVRGRRLDHARGLLTDPRQASRNIAEIALASGFGDISWFNNAFRKRFGMTPSEARTAAAVTRKNGQPQFPLKSPKD
jgi:AraC-like DNA-binding protein